MFQQGKRKVNVFWTCIQKKLNLFLRRLHYALSQFLCSLVRFDLAIRGVRQPVQLYTFYARLLVINKTLGQPEFAVVNSSDAVMSVFHSPLFNVLPDILAVMNCCVVALSLFSVDIVTWSADSLFSVQ